MELPADRRPAGHPTSTRLTALYSDPEITALLRRHRIPRRHRPGGIIDRFPTPARIIPGVLRAAYLDIAPAAVHIEQLTGHPAEQVLDLLHQHRKPPHPGPPRRRPLPLGTAGNTTTHDDPHPDNPGQPPSHRSQGSTAA